MGIFGLQDGHFVAFSKYGTVAIIKKQSGKQEKSGREVK